MMFILQGLLVFGLSVAVDVFWTKYTLAVSAKQALRAAWWSAGIAALGALTILSYMDDKRLLPFAVLGYFVGTWWAVRREKAE